MPFIDLIQLLIFFGILLLITKPIGIYLAGVYRNERMFLSPIIGPLERLIYRIMGVKPDQEMRWTTYSWSLLAFSITSGLIVYILLRMQHILPWNPQGFAGTTPDLSFNTAVSFLTNTNWQSYAGEATMSYFSQMAALAFQNFVSAAVGMCVAVALVRGLARSGQNSIGNFWVDLVRGSLYVLMPLSVLATLFFVSQGVIQNLLPYQTITTLEGVQQTIAMGPVASQEAIKMLGTNGGGFFNANSAHPFENPNALTSIIQCLMIFMIPAGLTYMYGRMVKDQKQGWTIFAAMSILFFAGFFAIYFSELSGNPIHTQLGVDQAITANNPGGNMEGKEVRFGILQSTLFANVTTDASCGAVNAMHDSFTPIGGMIPMINIMLGEVIFGGVGAGLYGILIFVLLAVFIAGLMVGRTPEYLGKKIEAKEVKLAILAVLAPVFAILGFTAWSVIDANGLKGLLNAGPHGLSEILYAFTSAAGNNGSAFAGLTANTPFYNTTLGIAMLMGRFLIIVPMLAIAGSMVKKTAVAPSPGTFRTNTPLFSVLLVAVIVIIGGLTFFPALSLGPILEHLSMTSNNLF